MTESLNDRIILTEGLEQLSAATQYSLNRTEYGFIFETAEIAKERREKTSWF